MIGRRTRLLSDTFFSRMFENDLFSSSVSASTAVMWLLAALATPGVMFSGSQYYFYAHARTFTPELQDRILFVSQVFHIAFVMAMAGLVTMLVWTSIAPDRRDALVLGPLPVTNGEQARAKLLSLLRLFLMFALAASLPTSVAFTFVTAGDANVTDVLLRIAGHVAGTMLGAAFVFFTLVALQVLLAAAFGPRVVAIAALPLQTCAVLGMVAALSMTRHLADALLAVDATGNAFILLNPVAWFVGVYRWVAGDAREVFQALGTRGVAVTLAAISLASLAYPLAYQRSADNVIDSEGRRARWWTGALSRAWLALMSPFLRTPLERGLAAFILAGFTRSHTHRFLIGSYVGVGVLFALPLAPRFVDSPDPVATQYAWFAVPLGLVCWTAAGLRVAMMLPIEPASNWIFKLTEPVDKARVISTGVTVMHGLTALPLAVGFGLAATVMHSAALGLTVFFVVLATGATLIELLTLALRAVPGTCTYRPGQLRLRLLWPVYLLTWLVLAYGIPSVAVRAGANAQSTILLVTSLVVLSASLCAWRHVRVRKLRQLVYEEHDTALVTTISVPSV